MQVSEKDGGHPDIMSSSKSRKRKHKDKRKAPEANTKDKSHNGEHQKKKKKKKKEHKKKKRRREEHGEGETTLTATDADGTAGAAEEDELPPQQEHDVGSQKRRKKKKQPTGAQQTSSGYFAHSWDEDKGGTEGKFKSGTWTLEEDAMLLRLFHEFAETQYGLKTQNEKLKTLLETTTGTSLNGFWVQFAQFFQFRTVRSVLRRAYRLLHPGNYGGDWTQEDFKSLRHYVEQYGHKWTKIGSLMGRLPNSCRNQYLRVLQKDFSSGAWTMAEEKRLTELVKKYSTRLGSSEYVGISWRAVEADMGTRSAFQCIKKWYSEFGARALGKPWSASEDFALVEAVQEDGASEWSEVAWNDLDGIDKPGPMCRNRLRNLAKLVSNNRSMSLPQLLDALENYFKSLLRDDDQSNEL